MLKRDFASFTDQEVRRMPRELESSKADGRRHWLLLQQIDVWWNHLKIEKDRDSEYEKPVAARLPDIVQAIVEASYEQPPIVAERVDHLGSDSRFRPGGDDFYHAPYTDWKVY